MTTVDFVQGDLLEADLPAPFALIHATGCSIIWKTPRRGCGDWRGCWRSVASSVSRYTAAMRGPRFRAARALIEERGWTADRAGIRAFRDHILSQPAGTPLATLAEADDFYSVSGCRDLAFHVQEHQFTVAEVGGLIADAGLRLVGIDPPAGSGGAADARDLAGWAALEREDPMLFAGMIYCWAQRPG